MILQDPINNFNLLLKCPNHLHVHILMLSKLYRSTKIPQNIQPAKSHFSFSLKKIPHQILLNIYFFSSNLQSPILPSPAFTYPNSPTSLLPKIVRRLPTQTSNSHLLFLQHHGISSDVEVLRQIFCFRHLDCHLCPLRRFCKHLVETHWQARVCPVHRR